METKFGRASVVMIASALNPSIIAPQWLKDNSLIIEEPKHFINTPAFSLFESESFSLLVDDRRLQITAKKKDRNSLISLASISSNYVKLFPHISYRTLGLNFVWIIEANKEEELPKIGLNINKSDLMPVFEGHEIDYGGIIYARKKPYVLKIVIEPMGKNILVHNFNYHHEIGGMSAEDLVSLIDSFLTRYEDSSRIVKGLYWREGK